MQNQQNQSTIYITTGILMILLSGVLAQWIYPLYYKIYPWLLIMDIPDTTLQARAGFLLSNLGQSIQLIGLIIALIPIINRKQK